MQGKEKESDNQNERGKPITKSKKIYEANPPGTSSYNPQPLRQKKTKWGKTLF